MRGYAAIGLCNPKTPMNVGGVMRAAQVYGAAMVVLSGQRFKKWPTDTMKAWRHIPVLEFADLLDAVPYDCVPVAVEIADGARTLPSYTHPERAFYIFGPEDSSISRALRSKCRDTVAIPSGCMNLAACVNVVLYDRLAKQVRSPDPHAVR
jgi:tRNA(Leu) C34 or U34 (ribose-2'-O)-methylase TrmL